MDPRQRACLEAMGIPVWRRREGQGQEGAPSAVEPEPLPAAVAPPAPVPDVPLGWEDLRLKVETCRACGIHTSRHRTVFGVGSRQARWLVVGEAPGADEDRQGEPFVGRAGKLLDAMLAAIGHPRDQVYIANTLKCRPPGNRDPLREELAACRPFLDRQIELLEPQLILAVGRVAAHALLGVDAAMGELRGKVHRYGPVAVPLVVTYHPSYLLRSPRQKRKAWMDLRLADTQCPT